MSCHPPRRHLPGPTRHRRRRRGAHPPTARRTGLQHGAAGRRRSRLEAGEHSARPMPPHAARLLPPRAVPGRGTRTAQHDGPGRTHQRRRPPPSVARHRDRPAGRRRGPDEDRRDAVQSRHPLRPWPERKRTPAGRAAHARPRPRHRTRPDRSRSSSRNDTGTGLQTTQENLRWHQLSHTVS